MPLPSRVQNQALARLRLALALVLLAAAGQSGGTVGARQAVPDVADVDLARASRGVTMRIGSPGRGRDALDIPLELYVAQVPAKVQNPVLKEPEFFYQYLLFYGC